MQCNAMLVLLTVYLFIKSNEGWHSGTLSRREWRAVNWGLRLSPRRRVDSTNSWSLVEDTSSIAISPVTWTMETVRSNLVRNVKLETVKGFE
jgi:hypothetical protein